MKEKSLLNEVIFLIKRLSTSLFHVIICVNGYIYEGREIKW